jgi:hypothetical protein
VKVPTSEPRTIEPLDELESAAFDLVEHVIRRDLGNDPARRVLSADVELVLIPGYVRVSYGVGEGVRTWIAGKTLAEAFEAARAVQRRGAR